MKIYDYKGFYGDHGRFVVYDDGTTVLHMNIAGTKERRRYKTFKSAKSALTRMSDSYRLTERKKGE